MSWPIATIGECCEVISGATPKTGIDSYWGGDIKWATPKDVSKLQSPYLLDTPDKITKKGFESCSTKLLPKGTVMVTSRAPIGNIAIAGDVMCTNQGFKSLIPKSNIDGTYLYHCMKAYSSKLAEQGNGATFKEVSKEIVENFEIPLPPLKDQKRIASILDKADSIRRKRQLAIEMADEFLRSVFLDMFGDPVTNSKKWEIGTIRDLITEAKYGTSAKAHETEGEFPVLRMGNITYEGGWDYSDLKYMNLSEDDKPKYLAQKGDLLFNRTNSKELVGKTAVFENEKPMAIAGYLIRVRPNKNGNVYYISGYLNSKHGKDILKNMCKSIVGMANINAQELQDIKIMMPPKKLQDKYSVMCDEVRSRVESMSVSNKDIESLFASLSQKAFSGGL